MCSKGQGTEMALRGAAIAALGDEGATIPLPDFGSNPTPAQQQNLDAIKAQNALVAQQNAARAAQIDSFVKAGLMGQQGATAQDKAVGDAAAAGYQRMRAKYGTNVDGMTVAQLMAAYPDDMNSEVSIMAQTIPGLAGKSPQEAYASMPDALKNMTLAKVIDLLPKNGASSLTPVGASNGISGMLLPIGIGLAAILGLFMIVGRKKQ